MPTPENKWSQKILLALTVLWLVLGAGLFSYMGSVPSPLNATIIRLAGFVLPDGEQKLWQSAPMSLRMDLDRIETEIRKTQSIFLTLGGSFKPVRVRINYQAPLRYRSDGEQIEIGSQIALAPGQLRHALVKAWILQNLDTRFTQSILRLNVLADALIAVSENGLSITAPRGGSLILDGEGATFAEQIATLGNHCLTEWAPTEVLHLCESLKPEHTMHQDFAAFSLRRTLAQTLWSSVDELGAFDRVQFLKKWLTYLQEPTSDLQNSLSPTTPVGISKWLVWTHGEANEMLPSEILAKRNMTLLPVDRIPADLAARFESEEGLKHFEADMKAKKYQIGQPTFKAAVVQIGKKSFLFPGGVPLTREDLSVVKTNRSIWESCKYPSVDAIINDSVRADRALLVRRCKGEPVSPLYRSYMAYGVEGFALDNPDLQFVQIHRPSLEFAAEKGLMAHADFFQHLGQEYLTGADRKLGLADAQWNQQIGAFRVIGAIEAIEWFRSSQKPTPN